MTQAPARFEPPRQAGIGRIVIDRPDGLNTLNPELVDALGAAVRAARGCSDLQGLVIASAKPDVWVAGADLKLLRLADASDLHVIGRRFQAVCDELAWLPCTSVAAINGAALGGGCELALACDYRVAVDLPALRIGQPEVNLGLLPAGGGTQRLPRLIGLARALDLILSGRQLDARRARRAGLVDEVVHPSVLDAAARAWAGRPKRPLDRPLSLGAIAELTPVGRRFMYRKARQRVLQRTQGHYPAPLLALNAIRVGMEEGMAAGLEAETDAFAELATSPTARNLIWLFLTGQHHKRTSPLRGSQDSPRLTDSRQADQGPAYPRARRASSSGPDEPAAGGTAPAAGGTALEAGGTGRHGPKIERLGVVGAGFMGAGIAEVAAAAGLTVRLRDVKPEAVARGLGTIRQLVEQAVARRRFRATEGAAIVQRVSGTIDYSGFQHADAVIEAVFEDLEVKRQVLAEIESLVADDTLIASNTSALPIGEVARVSKRPERVVGMHFFSPVHRMPLVEVVRGPASSPEAVARAANLARQLGKTPIVVGDGPGFYTSRVLGVMLNEAAVLMQEGAAIQQVDAAMTAFGFPVGPFVLFDEVGLQVAQHAGETLFQAFGERLPRTEIVPRLVAAGHTGKQAGLGFYDWRTRRPNPEFSQGRRRFSQQEIQERLVLLFVNEAARCLDEGILESAADGDLGAVLGLGFPPFLGGPFHYADSRPDMRDKLERLAEQHGPRYSPCVGGTYYAP